MRNDVNQAVAKYWKASKRVSFDASDKQDIYKLLGRAEALIAVLHNKVNLGPNGMMLAALETVAEDCQMALSGEWDRGDDGFEATLDVVNTAIGRVKNSQRGEALP